VGDEIEAPLRGPPRGDDPTQLQADRHPVSVDSMRAVPPVGTLIGKYVVESAIGSGGMGIVVAARHQQLGELVAIKLLHPKAAKDKVQVERFVREARATARIKSEHVVRVIDAGEDEPSGAPYIVMEHLEGNDLSKILKMHGAMPVTMAVDMMLQICEAVASAHALGIIHRDLKPSNFFVSARADGSPHVKVLDFGISKANEQNGLADPRLTETQAVFGSPTYMSPEQIRSSKNVDPRSDVWSLGVGLFEMLTTKLPFVSDNVSGLLASVVADAPFRPSIFTTAVPPELEAIVLGCLEKDPARRIPSAAELARLLTPFASPDGAQLAARIERVARVASGQSYPPGAGVFPSSSYPSLPPPMSSAPLSHASVAGSGGFGSTGDLSATGPPRRTQRGALVGVGLLLAGVGLLLVAGCFGVYFARQRPPPPTSPAPAAQQPPPSAQPLPPPVEVVPSAAPVASTPERVTSTPPLGVFSVFFALRSNR